MAWGLDYGLQILALKKGYWPENGFRDIKSGAVPEFCSDSRELKALKGFSRWICWQQSGVFGQFSLIPHCYSLIIKGHTVCPGSHSLGSLVCHDKTIFST